jgi:hypothetical protein
MADKKPLTTDASFDLAENIITIPATNLEKTDYVLRVFQDKSNQEILYKSTRLQTQVLVHTDAGFQCSGVNESAGCKFEIKNVKTNTVVVTGLIKVTETPASVQTKKNEEKENKK